VNLGKKGLQTIPFTFEDGMLEALSKGELDAALATPATIGYYNMLHRDAPVTLMQDYETRAYRNCAGRSRSLWRRSTPRSPSGNVPDLPVDYRI
jgi:ABC-type amino acid transport substrate-binding protein